MSFLLSSFSRKRRNLSKWSLPTARSLIIPSNFDVNCEPQLAKHGLYPTISKKDSKKKVQEILSLIAYADGNHTLLEIADKIGVFAGDLVPIVKKILEANLFDKVKDI